MHQSLTGSCLGELKWFVRMLFCFVSPLFCWIIPCVYVFFVCVFLSVWNEKNGIQLVSFDMIVIVFMYAEHKLRVFIYELGRDIMLQLLPPKYMTLTYRHFFAEMSPTKRSLKCIATTFFVSLYLSLHIMIRTWHTVSRAVCIVILIHLYWMCAYVISYNTKIDQERTVLTSA